ncbi:hypothetical protein V5O48_016514 [Marasmius crinis-equi]|uniref:Uncharacterized protein n=1 Tax=Marasmius crinis-equi TaxID=585013 RepID=A0ABR3ERK6_9AGAR
MSLNYTSLPVPVVQNANDAVLGAVVFDLLNTHPDLDPTVRTARSSHEQWLEKYRRVLLSDPSLLTAIYTWATNSLCLSWDEVAGVGHRQMVNMFISAMTLIKVDRMDAARLHLARMQVYIVNEWSAEQHNITDLKHDVGDEDKDSMGDGDDEDNGEEEEEEEDDDDDEDYEDNAMDVDEESDDDEDDDEDEDNNNIRMEADEVDTPPVDQEYTGYLQTCLGWHAVLDRVISLPVESLTQLVVADSVEDPDPPEFVALNKAVVACLREVKKVGKRQYSRPAFIDAVKGGTKSLEKGRELFEALRKNPALIPTTANPSSVFFLCSEHNFVSAWHRWLKWHLRVLDYNVLVPNKDAKEIYRGLMRYLNDIINKTPAGQSPWRSKKKPVHQALELIVLESVKLRDRREKLAKTIREVKGERVAKEGQRRPDCKQCSHLPLEDQCWTTVVVKRNTNQAFLESMRGKGVTFVPREEQMQPTKSRDASKPVTEIVCADSLDTPLKKISAREDVLERCQKQIIVIEDEDKPGVMLDFVCYNAFPPETLSLLIEYHNMATGVHPLVRGAQFDFWSSGAMYPFGARSPNGGRPGDTYTHYAGITAQTILGIKVLFRQATTLAILLEVGGLINPQAVQDLKDAGELCESGGLSGVNLYTCDDYTAPLHTDNDAVRGLCGQFVKNVLHPEYEEYGFCNLRYGYYISTRKNMLWSFNGNDMHGTILPSQETVIQAKQATSPLRLRGGASRGPHPTVNKKNKKHAKENEQTRHNYNLRSRVWAQ